MKNREIDPQQIENGPRDEGRKGKIKGSEKN